MKKSPDIASSPKQEVADDAEQRKQEFLSQGFIDATDFPNSIDLEKEMWDKTISAVYYKSPEPEVVTGLEITEFRDLHGYGIKLPDESILLTSRYHRAPESNKPPEGWLFKIE